MRIRTRQIAQFLSPHYLEGLETVRQELLLVVRFTGKAYPKSALSVVRVRYFVNSVGNMHRDRAFGSNCHKNGSRSAASGSERRTCSNDTNQFVATDVCDTYPLSLKNFLFKSLMKYCADPIFLLKSYDKEVQFLFM